MSDSFVNTVKPRYIASRYNAKLDISSAFRLPRFLFHHFYFTSQPRYTAKIFHVRHMAVHMFVRHAVATIRGP